ncbi:2-hydroxycarboxylate transporter family protein [Geosporobacter ferrireducens]|uniref:Citrate:sodium symporter n=1 Tax=Geosporobacter ferrireducens TaxID=1424294 RepID=A0A1D8GK84_9FIRM|nr:2-hydroxycarboxylate transporter family protein [Geosporobacter ferrireducens]AOT71323.1 hypothetical protein Gferi_18240 [Geosporobacter ferrireducens]
MVQAAGGKVAAQLQARTKWYAFGKVDKVFGIHIKYFFPMAILVGIATKFGLLPEGLVGTFAFLMAIGGVFSWIGAVTPLLREIGGFLIMPLIGAILLNKIGFIPETYIVNTQTLMGSGFQMFFVTGIIVGSILAMDRRLMLASVARYIPVLILSQLFALGAAFLAAKLTGTSIYDAVFLIAAPCMTGGTGGAIATLPALYSSILGTNASALGGQMLAVAVLGENISLLFVVIMKVLAIKFPKFMGNGQGELLSKESEALKEARRTWQPYEESSLDYAQLGAGLFTGAVIMTLGVIVSRFIPVIVYVGWAVILCIILKVLNVIPDTICRAANYWGQFAIKNLVIIVVSALGLSSMGGVSMGSVLNTATVAIIVITFIGAILGAMLASKIFGLYRYEGALTAASCSCNIGLSGDLQMLIISDRLNLFSFATISTRIGGAMMLLYLSIIFPIVARALGKV